MKKTEAPSKKNQIFNLVDKAPFAGKFAVKDSYIGYITASDEKRTRRAITSTAFLGFMVAAHAYQAKIGFDSLATHAPAAIEDAKARDIVFAGVDGAYALAMSAVTLRQADLMRKVGVAHTNWLKIRRQVPEAERKVEKREYTHKKTAIALAVTATLAGQIAESVSMGDALVQEYQKHRHVNEIYEDPGYYDDMYQTNRVYITPNNQTGITHVSPDKSNDSGIGDLPNEDLPPPVLPGISK